MTVIKILIVLTAALVILAFRSMLNTPTPLERQHDEYLKQCEDRDADPPFRNLR
jgi:hypothetical protein